MNKLILLAIAVAALALVYLSLGGTAPTNPPGADRGSAAPVPQSAAGLAPLPPPMTPVTAPAFERRADAPTSLTIAAPMPATVPGPSSQYGRPPNAPMLTAKSGEVRDTLRRFYANLPQSGRLDGPVHADDVLPLSLLRDWNIPAASIVTQIGERAVTDIEAVPRVLDRPADAWFMVGFTIITPDGREIRDYVRVTP